MPRISEQCHRPGKQAASQFDANEPEIERHTKREGATETSRIAMTMMRVPVMIVVRRHRPAIAQAERGS